MRGDARLTHVSQRPCSGSVAGIRDLIFTFYKYFLRNGFLRLKIPTVANVMGIHFLSMSHSRDLRID